MVRKAFFTSSNGMDFGQVSRRQVSVGGRRTAEARMGNLLAKPRLVLARTRALVAEVCSGFLSYHLSFTAAGVCAIVPMLNLIKFENSTSASLLSRLWRQAST